MKKQKLISIRLPEHLVQKIDVIVSTQKYYDRSAFIRSALEAIAYGLSDKDQVKLLQFSHPWWKAELHIDSLERRDYGEARLMARDLNS